MASFGRTAKILVLGVVVLTAVGCRDGNDETDQPAPDAQAVDVASDRGPYDPAAEMRPDLMRIEPSTASAGQVVELYLPEETVRGVAFVLEQRLDDGWSLRYYLTSDPQHPSWGPASEDYAWNSLGLLGPGPDPVIIPPGTAPGDYRICTANAARNFCAPLRVSAT